MLIVGLTGGIGSGKSTVSKLFEDLGVPIIDADIIARQVVEPGQPALQEIINQFGNAILSNSGALDRKKLRQYLTNHPGAKEWLEACLHPRIRDNIALAQSQLPKTTPYCLYVIPLLAENWDHYQHIIDHVIVVDIPQEQQIQRSSERDNSNPEHIKKIIQMQIPREERLKIANDIIDNTKPFEDLKIHVQSLHKKLLTLSSSR